MADLVSFSSDSHCKAHLYQSACPTERTERPSSPPPPSPIEDWAAMTMTAEPAYVCSRRKQTRSVTTLSSAPSHGDARAHATSGMRRKQVRMFRQPWCARRLPPLSVSRVSASLVVDWRLPVCFRDICSECKSPLSDPCHLSHYAFKVCCYKRAFFIPGSRSAVHGDAVGLLKRTLAVTTSFGLSLRMAPSAAITKWLSQI